MSTTTGGVGTLPQPGNQRRGSGFMSALPSPRTSFGCLCLLWCCGAGQQTKTATAPPDRTRVRPSDTGTEVHR